MTIKSGRSSKRHPSRPIEIVYFPKRYRPLGAEPVSTEEIHTERVDRDRLAGVENTDPRRELPYFEQATTEREIRVVDLQLMTPEEAPAALGMLEDPGATLSYHRSRLREMVATTPPDRPLSDTADLSLFAHSLLEQGR